MKTKKCKHCQEEIAKSAKRCPKCGGKLIMFHGEYGDFLGCSNYNLNQCKYTRKINKKA